MGQVVDQGKEDQRQSKGGTLALPKSRNACIIRCTSAPSAPCRKNVGCVKWLLVQVAGAETPEPRPQVHHPPQRNAPHTRPDGMKCTPTPRLSSSQHSPSRRAAGTRSTSRSRVRRMVARRVPMPVIGVVAAVKLKSQVSAERNEFAEGLVVANQPGRCHHQESCTRPGPRFLSRERSSRKRRQDSQMPSTGSTERATGINRAVTAPKTPYPAHNQGDPTPPDKGPSGSRRHQQRGQGRCPHKVGGKKDRVGKEDPNPSRPTAVLSPKPCV